MIVSKISAKGQIVIPKEIRELMGYKPGDAIIFKIRDKEVILVKIEESLNDILKECGPLSEDSITFQRNLREDWT